MKRLAALSLLVPLAMACNQGADDDQVIAEEAATETLSSTEEAAELATTADAATEAALEADVADSPEDIAAAVGAKLQALVDAAQNGCEAVITVSGAQVTAAWGNAAGCSFGSGAQSVVLSGESVLTVTEADATSVVFDIETSAQVAQTVFTASTTITVNPNKQEIDLVRQATATRGADSFSVSYNGSADRNGDQLVLNLDRSVSFNGESLREQSWNGVTLQTGVLFPIAGTISADGFRGRSVDIAFSNDGGDIVTVTATLDGRRADLTFVFSFDVASGTLSVDE